MTQRWFQLCFSGSHRVDRPLQIGEHDLHGTNDDELFFGTRIGSWNPDSFYRSMSADDDGDPDDVLCEHLGLPTFSKRLRRAMEDAAVAINDIQYLPVRVFKSTREEVKVFSIANVVSRVAALDYKESKMLLQDESEIDPLTGSPKVTGIWTAALRRGPLEGHDMIRLVEFFPPIYVSERFADVFHFGGYTGAILKPVKLT